MPPDPYLHERSDFSDLVRIVADERGLLPALVEKDYWIMHCLYGLATQGFTFELKGGTSLSKGFGIIQRFSEDIDIRINPACAPFEVFTGANQTKKARHNESSQQFYDWLADTIQIEGISNVERDHAFDDEKFRNGGIRLHYNSTFDNPAGLKEGILLETGFDDTQPNSPQTISSWAYDKAAESAVAIKDNRTIDVLCYHPGYTLAQYSTVHVEIVSGHESRTPRQPSGRLSFQTKFIKQRVLIGWQLTHHKHRSLSVITVKNYLRYQQPPGVFQQNRPQSDIPR